MHAKALTRGAAQPSTRVPALTLAALLVATSALAQGRITGTVRNEDGQPVKGAIVTGTNPNAAPSERTSTSDGKGRFAFLGLRSGEWTFTIEAPGYEPAQTRSNVRSLGPNASLEIVLQAVPEIAPSGPLATVDVGDLHERLDQAAAREKAGKLDDAIGIYRDIASRVPALTSVRLQIALLQERKGNTAAAAAEYQAVLKADPSNEKARAGLARLSQQDKHPG